MMFMMSQVTDKNYQALLFSMLHLLVVEWKGKDRFVGR